MKKKIIILPIALCFLTGLQQSTVYANKYEKTPVYGLDGTLIEGETEDVIKTEGDKPNNKNLLQDIMNTEILLLDYVKQNPKDENVIKRLLTEDNMKITYYKDMKLMVALSDNIIEKLDFESLPKTQYFNPKEYESILSTKSPDIVTIEVMELYNQYFNLYGKLITGKIEQAQSALSSYINATKRFAEVMSTPYTNATTKPKDQLTLYDYQIAEDMLFDIVWAFSDRPDVDKLISVEAVKSMKNANLETINAKAKKLFNITIPSKENNLTAMNKVNMQYAFDLYDKYQKEKDINTLLWLNRLLSNTLIINEFYK